MRLPTKKEIINTVFWVVTIFVTLYLLAGSNARDLYSKIGDRISLNKKIAENSKENTLYKKRLDRLTNDPDFFVRDTRLEPRYNNYIAADELLYKWKK